MKTMIVCGGRGMRLNEETEFKPKPIVHVGGYPILLHIMNIYAHYGHTDFILCLGYKGDMIKDYFLNMSKSEDDFEFNMKTGKVNPLYKNHKYDYNITFAETGLDTLTSERVLRALKYVEDDEHFMVTYGDGVSTIDINKLIDYHMKKEKSDGILATISAVHPTSKYGKVTFDKSNVVTMFEEKKPILDDYINGGFQIFNKKATTYFKNGEMLEDSLIRLSEDRKLAVYVHDGFWHCLDTMKHVNSLNKLWEDTRPWAVWEKSKEAEK